MKFLTLTLCLLLFGVLTGFSSCSQIKYEADLGFLNSAQANSLEELVYIQNKVCKDMDGQIGICSKRVRSDEVISFKQEPQQYEYKFVLTCSNALGVDFSKVIPANQELKFDIKPESFSTVKSFTCIGESYPADRPTEVSIKWELRAKIYDKDYVKLDQITTFTNKGKKYLLLGKHAKYSTVFLDGKRVTFKEKTNVEIQTDNVKAIVESELGRVNYLNVE